MQKVHGFREGYPAYAKHQVYFGMASMVTNNRDDTSSGEAGYFSAYAAAGRCIGGAGKRRADGISGCMYEARGL